MSEEADAVPSVDVPLAEDLSSVGGGEDAKTRAAQRKEELRKRQAEAIQRNRGERDEANSEFKPKEEKADTKPATAPKQKVLRKDQIENAVRFLSHPKVKDSPLGKRIAFLEHKGLNDDEISEALKRANVSAEDIKAAQAQQESQYEGSRQSFHVPFETQSLLTQQGMMNKDHPRRLNRGRDLSFRRGQC